MKQNTHTGIEPLESRIAPAVFIVTTTSDTGPGSLRQALFSADTHPGLDIILFHLPAPPAHGVNTILLGSDLTTTGDVSIVGPGSGNLIINGNNAHAILQIKDNTVGTDSPVGISGLSMVNANALHGAVYSTESLSLSNVIVSGNTGTSDGGGVTVFGDTLAGTKVKITNSRIIGNTSAHFGGGLALEELKSISITSSAITGNTSANFDGGGMYVRMSNLATGLMVSACRIAGNVAAAGGGICLKSDNTSPTSVMTISGSVISGNQSNETALTGGGGILALSGNTLVTGSSIIGNTAVYSGAGMQAGGFTSLTISHSTLSGNATTKGTGANAKGGGGLYVMGNASATPAPVKIASSVFSGNNGLADGGGIYAHNGVGLTISTSIFTANSTGGTGAGICTIGETPGVVNVVVSGSTFTDNFGGALYAGGNGTLSVISSTFKHNIGPGGAAINIDHLNSAALTKLIVAGNISSGSGGGISIDFVPDFTISGGSFTVNEALFGGAISTFLSTGTIKGAIISNNVATMKGGGVYSTISTVTLQVSKVTGNTAPLGPNLYGTFTYI